MTPAVAPDISPEAPVRSEAPGQGDTATAFRMAMRGVTSTVTLVTARSAAGDWRGIAATAFASVTLEPPTCLVCVNRDASIHPALVETGRFCVNALHQDHYHLMSSFTRSVDRDSRFRSGGWRAGRDGVPFVADAQASMFCQVSEMVSVGTHDIVLGRVVEVLCRADCDPLLYGNSAYFRQAGR